MSSGRSRLTPSEDRTPAMTPQLALRVALVGTCALAMFAIVFFRLWFLQVLSGNQYVAQAAANFVQDIPIQSPRGDILDRNGKVLVSSQLQPAVLVSPPDLPKPVTRTNIIHQPRQDLQLYNRLAPLLGMSTKPGKCSPIVGYSHKVVSHGKTVYEPNVYRMAEIPCMIAQQVAKSAAYSNVTLATGVSSYLQSYLLERASKFPGVVVQQDPLRTYADGDAGAQLFGTVGPLSCDNPKVKSDCEAEQAHFKGVPKTDEVGQSGLEYEYNQWLQGTDGYDKVKVNAQGAFEGYSSGPQPQKGQDLKLSIDSNLEKVGQQALARSIAANPGADGGAFVALDPQNGQVLGMGSNPTYDPSIFTKPMSQAQYNQFDNPVTAPLVNRAVQSVGPTGSTFKVITATAAMQSGAWTPYETYDDTGRFCETGGLCRRNSGGAAYGVVDMQKAIQVSDDDFFYNLGQLLNVKNPLAQPQGGQLQAWARKFGIGQNPGIDLPGAAKGTLPTPAWREHINKLEQECDDATGPYKGGHKHAPGGCGLAVYPFESWTEGDNVNMAVGQGDVQVSPLQLAVVYSALANGGTIVTPHVGMDIQSSSGTVLRKIDPGPRRKLHIDQTYLDTILAGLHAAAQGGGTSSDVMGNFGKPVYGKTGTAQYFTASQAETDYAWYACFVPASATSKPIVVVVWVEKGGFGDVAAAPVARQILSQWFYGKPGPYVSGTSTTL